MYNSGSFNFVLLLFIIILHSTCTIEANSKVKYYQLLLFVLRNHPLKRKAMNTYTITQNLNYEVFTSNLIFANQGISQCTNAGI